MVFRNQELIVVDKSAGQLTTPARTGAADPRPCLGRELQADLGQQIYPVHRLDFEVSGLVIFALNPRAHAQANFWFENRMIHKTYQALTSGEPSEGWLPGHKLVWQNLLLRGKRRSYESPVGKSAETHAEWLGWRDSRMLWNLNPVTGRPHQLRVHLFQNGFPILGDELYGSLIPYKPQEIALRAFRLEFGDIPLPKRLGLPEVLQTESLA